MKNYRIQKGCHNCVFVYAEGSNAHSDDDLFCFYKKPKLPIVPGTWQDHEKRQDILKKFEVTKNGICDLYIKKE
jgi:hypothetical protein